MESDFNTTQTDWAEEVKKIRWHWPYIKRTNPNLDLSEVSSQRPDMIDFIIPFEYRKKSKEEVKEAYGRFFAVFEYLAEPEVFFKIHSLDGTETIRSCIASVFICSFEPQKE